MSSQLIRGTFTGAPSPQQYSREVARPPLHLADMELDHILWPSDPGMQRPGDPVDPVTLFYNELQMSTYVADKRLQWARSLPGFIAVWRLHASRK